MNIIQRAVLALYCIVLAYCCVWIPWRVTTLGRHNLIEIEYSFVWRAPSGYNGVEPDVQLILLRIGAATAVAGALFLLAPVITRRSAAWRQ